MGLSIKAPTTTNLPPVGACIYCGATSGRLTKEHIVPEGLGGTLVLPSASCDQCCETTSKFERRVLQGFLDDGRSALGIKGKKKHKRKRQDTIQQSLILPDQTIERRDVPVAKGYRVMHLPVFTLPAFLDPSKEIADTNGVDIRAIDTTTFVPEASLIGQADGPVGAQFNDRLDVWAFVRMLAKIAHGYHVAVHGLCPHEESPLLPIILDQRHDARNWIGCIEDHPLPSDRPSLHLLAEDTLTDDNGGRCSAVRIKLFAPHQGPTYVLAARISDPAHTPADIARAQGS